MGLSVQIINISELPPLAYDEDMIKQLNQLITLHRDAEDGYRAASDLVPNPSLQTMFMQYSAQHQRFVFELAEIVVQMGGDPDQVNWRGKWSQRQATQIGAILSDDEYHTQCILQHYQRVLDHATLPSYVRQVLSQQSADLSKIHQHLRDLRNLYY